MPETDIPKPPLWLNIRSQRANQMDWNSPQILNTEQNLLRRRVKEEIAIHTHKKTLNRDTGLELSKV